MPRVVPSLSNRLTQSLADAGVALRATRQSQHRSAEHVAQAAGITRKTLQRVERGDASVAVGIYLRVLDALGLSNGPALQPVAPSRRDPASLDARSLAMHQRIAAKVREQPALLQRARATIDRWQQHGASPASAPYLESWRHLIDQGMDVALAAAVEPSERGNALRQASPFTGVLNNRERWALLRASRHAGAHAHAARST
jgi:transcriptional regulator with XRE-family HTH domain